MKTLEKVIKDAVAANKYSSGTRQVLKTAKDAKLIIVSRSLDAEDRAKLDEQAKSGKAAVYEFGGNSVQLGKLCNMPFRVSAIAIRGTGDKEIAAIMAEKGK